jgi:hypothetical protein
MPWVSSTAIAGAASCAVAIFRLNSQSNNPTRSPYLKSSPPVGGPLSGPKKM